PALPGLLALASLGLLAAWTALGLDVTSSDERTLAEVTRVLHHGGLLLLVTLTLDRSTWRSALGGVTAAALGVCVIAMANRLTAGGLAHDLVVESFGTRRISYPLNYWNAVGAWGVMSTLLGLAWSAH